MMSTNRAFQAISSIDHECREWMVWLNASSSPVSEAMISALPARSCSRVWVTKGLSGVSGWTTVQLSAKTVDWLRRRCRSMLRRMGMPSLVSSETSRVTRICASATWLPRWLATRNMSDCTPSKVATTARSLHRTRAVGRANLANMRPVAMATPMRPISDSSVTSALAACEIGTMCPYPMVAMVCTLKKNASAYDREPAVHHEVQHGHGPQSHAPGRPKPGVVHVGVEVPAQPVLHEVAAPFAREEPHREAW